MDDERLIQPENASVFARNAPAMRGQQLAVVPVAHDRRPHITGFNKWRARPGPRRVNEWCQRFGEANIGVLPGLCGPGATVFDCESPDAAAEVEDRFGKSDLHIRTRRGRHLWYAKAGLRLPGNLRKFGLDVDIKAGNQIVIAPPSVHESGIVYQLDGCDWSALHRLRKLDLEALQAFTGKLKVGKAKHSEARSGLVVEGERRITLNSRLVRHAFDCHDFDAMMYLARTLNAKYLPPMEDWEVIEIATHVWKDKANGEIKPWARRPSVRTDVDELARLNRHGAKSGDALMLLMKLRTLHSRGNARGESFPISAQAMADAQVLDGWSRRRIENARRILLNEGFVRLVSAFKVTAAGRRAALFELASPPSISGGRGGG
jgi:Bifunctional DNA primase/polymerase, N-terminal